MSRAQAAVGEVCAARPHGHRVRWSVRAVTTGSVQKGPHVRRRVRPSWPATRSSTPTSVDYLIIFLYFAVVLGIGVLARRQVSDSLDFFLSGRSLPAWVTGLAFISANLGAVEIMGMSANGAEFGLPTVHYFWVGAIPAMLFLGVVMMPFYYGSKVRSVPEFMRRRFGTGAHLVNAISFAVAQLLIAGVNLYLLGTHRPRAARLAAVGRADRRRGDRAVLHHPRRPERRDLQRGAAVLRDRGVAAAADPDRPAPGRRLGRAHRQDHRRPPTTTRPARPPTSS